MASLMNIELERICKEAVVHFKIPLRHLPRGTEIDKDPDYGWPVCWPVLETEPSRTESRSSNLSTTMLGDAVSVSSKPLTQDGFHAQILLWPDCSIEFSVCFRFLEGRFYTQWIVRGIEHKCVSRTCPFSKVTSHRSCLLQFVKHLAMPILTGKYRMLHYTDWW
jgi:hypothetical protein